MAIPYSVMATEARNPSLGKHSPWRVVVAALALVLGITPLRADITNGLVAYYSFENLTGVGGETVVDQSGRGHNGVCRQDQNTLRAPTIVSGPSGLGDALDFDGGFYVEVPNHADFNITDNITVAAWVAVDAFDQDWQTVFCRGDWSWRLHRSGSSDYAAFHLSGLSNGPGADGATTNLRVPKRWLHLVATYKNGVGAKLYINGASEASNSSASGLISTSGSDPVTIGAQINSGTLQRRWRGQLDEVRLYNRALSATDAAELYGYVQTNVNNRPVIVVPEEQVLSAPASLQLSATVTDDGKPLPANPANPNSNDANKLRWNWSVVSVPSASAGVAWSGAATNGEAFTYLGSSNAPGTVFTCNPTARFDVPGLYVLSFSASDGQKASSNNVIVWVRAANDYRALGYSYLSPLPGAEYSSPQTRYILVRFQNISPSAITNLAQCIRVTGAQSGPHAGQTSIAGDGRTVRFQMSSDFVGGEWVTVSLAPGVPPAAGGPMPAYSYPFIVSGHLPGVPVSPSMVMAPSAQILAEAASPVHANDLTTSLSALVATMPNGVSVPSDFPQINITTNYNPDPDPIFIDNRGGGGKCYNVIFDNAGSPLWYMRMPDERRDMKVQHNGVMTMLARDGAGIHFNGFDTHYQLITNYWAANGYSGDEHELQVLADGTYFLVGLRTETVDMSRYAVGGNAAASVTEEVIQGFTPAGELSFQWRAWDHLDILDEQAFVDLLGSGLDFPHMNAIDVDTDGNLLLSSRNTSEVTKINRETGEIIWRLGGAHNQFTYVNDPLSGPRNQHCIRMVGTNRYTLFDNGNLHSPSMSRAVEYVINPTNLTATDVWQYPNPATSSVYSFYMGNVQRLTNGNTLINWAIGSLPKLTEVRPDGSKAFEMNWAEGWEAYRTWRCPWQGSAVQPYLIVEPYPDNLTLIFNQFGDTNVAFYRIYGGTAPQPTNLLATSVGTLKQLSNLQNGSTYYFRVSAVNRQGVEGLYSNEASTTVSIIKPGQNMVANGDFAQGTASWIWALAGSATAAWQVENGVSHVYITNATTTASNIQLRQAGKPLVQGKKYVLEFDAWCSPTSRYIEAKVGQDVSPFQLYGGSSSVLLTPTHNHYRFVFTMTPVTDFNARVVFNMGGSALGVYLDNVSLYNAAAGDLNQDGKVGLLDLQLFSKDWLKQSGGLAGDLDGSGNVDFTDLSILGENWSSGN